MHNRFKRRVAASVFVSVVVVALMGCQTTSDFKNARPIKASDMWVSIPMKEEGVPTFGVLEIKERGIGNFDRQSALLEGGLFLHDRYLNGGFLDKIATDLKRHFDFYFDSGEATLGTPRDVTLPIGTFSVAEFDYLKYDTKCMVYSGPVGRRMQLQGGTGHRGMIFAYFCNKNGGADLEAQTVAWMEELRLR